MLYTLLLSILSSYKDRYILRFYVVESNKKTRKSDILLGLGLFVWIFVYFASCIGNYCYFCFS